MREVRQLYLTLTFLGVLVFSYFSTGGHDDQRVLQVIFLLFFCGIELARLSRKKYLMPGNEIGKQWYLTLFFLLGTVSSINALSQRHAFYELSNLLLLLLLSVSVAEEIFRDSHRYLSLILKICGIGCLLYAFEVVVIYLAALSLDYQPAVAAFAPGFSNYRFLNHTQTITLPLLVLLVLSFKPGDKMRFMSLLLAGFWWALLFVTAGRGTFVGLVTGCVLASLLPQARGRSFCRAMLLTGLLGLAIYAVFFAFIPIACGFEPFGEFFNLAQRTVANPTSSRVDLWRRAIELIVAHPWLGVGPLHYAHYAIDVQVGAHPHNWVLQIGAEWGLPALMCLCAGIGISIMRLIKTTKFIAISDASNNNFLAAWIAIGFAILVDGMFSGLIVMPASQLFIALYLGCAVGWVLSIKAAGPVLTKTESGLKRAFLPILLLISMLALINGVWPEIMSVIKGELISEADAQIYNGTLRPRLWSAGFF